MIVFIIERFEPTNRVNKKKAIIVKENEQKMIFFRQKGQAHISEQAYQN